MRKLVAKAKEVYSSNKENCSLFILEDNTRWYFYKYKGEMVLKQVGPALYNLIIKTTKNLLPENNLDVIINIKPENFISFCCDSGSCGIDGVSIFDKQINSKEKS